MRGGGLAHRCYYRVERRHLSFTSSVSAGISISSSENTARQNENARLNAKFSGGKLYTCDSLDPVFSPGYVERIPVGTLKKKGYVGTSRRKKTYTLCVFEYVLIVFVLKNEPVRAYVKPEFSVSVLGKFLRTRAKKRGPDR